MGMVSNAGWRGELWEGRRGKTRQRFSEGDHRINLLVHTSVSGAKCPVKKNCPFCFVFVLFGICDTHGPRQGWLGGKNPLQT